MSHPSERPDGSPAQPDDAVVDELLPLFYDRLRDIASGLLGPAAGPTLQPTAVVHEVYLRLARANPDRQFDREHFMCLAARAIRQVLVDHTRGRATSKRGGGWERVSLSLEPETGGSLGGVSAIDVVDSLGKLEALDKRQARVVELRVFGGMTIPEVARVLEVAPRTVDTQWRIARAWLQAELAERR